MANRDSYIAPLSFVTMPISIKKLFQHHKLWLLVVSVAILYLTFWAAPHHAQEVLDLPQQQLIGDLELVATIENPMPTGVTVSEYERIFVNFPRWGDRVDFTVAEIINGRLVAYPNQTINRPDLLKPTQSLISVQSVVVDERDRLWILDTGRIEFEPVIPGGAKLVGVDLRQNRLFQTIIFPSEVALPTTYLNDMRFDLNQGKEGFAYITDSSSTGPNGIIVVDLASGESWRRLEDHPSTQAEPNFIPYVEGQPLLNRPADGNSSYMQVGADGIALSADGSRLFYCSLSGRHLYSVNTDRLIFRNFSDEEVAESVEDLGFKGASDGLESDSQNRIYITDYEHNAIRRRLPEAMPGTEETLVLDPRVLWPDTLAVAPDGYLYFTANQLHRQPGFHWGEDQRRSPYSIFRVKIDKQSTAS